MPGGSGTSGCPAKNRAGIRLECRRADRKLDELARHRPLDRQLHRHARPALARCISHRGLGADAGRAIESETIATTIRGLAALTCVCSLLSVAIIRSRAMKVFCLLESPIGRLMRTTAGTAAPGFN